MAKNDKKSEAKKSPEVDTDLPEGFVPLGRGKVTGWFIREEGNTVRGFLKDSFTVKSKDRKYPDKKVYVIEISGGETNVMNAEGEPEIISEGTVGVDETGYLKKLGDLEKGREVFLKCKGKDGTDRDSPWIFAVGVVPF